MPDKIQYHYLTTNRFCPTFINLLTSINTIVTIVVNTIAYEPAQGRNKNFQNKQSEECVKQRWEPLVYTKVYDTKTVTAQSTHFCTCTSSINLQNHQYFVSAGQVHFSCYSTMLAVKMQKLLGYKRTFCTRVCMLSPVRRELIFFEQDEKEKN